MGTGASTAGSKGISLDTFKSVSAEYDKLKSVGLSVEEMHMILVKRLESMGPDDHKPQKDDEIRAPMQTPLVKEVVQTLRINTASQESKQPPVAEEEQPNGMVLLIDDSAVAAKVASKVLTNLHFEVITAKSAKLGYDILLARKDEIILVFLDVVMPTVDGVECLQWIKDNPEVAHIPVYMLSGLEDQLLKDVCTERGAEGTLLKPLNPSVVKAIIKAHNLGTGGKVLSANTTPTALSADKSERTTDAIKTIINHKSRSPKAAAQQVTVAVHSQGPAFKLCDSDFQVYVFPNMIKLPPAAYLVFVPTIYMTDLYMDNAFIPQLFTLHDRLIANGDVIVVISGDLPYSLAAGKARFSLPFDLVSDPSLSVAERYVGTIDIGKYLARPEAFAGENGDLLPSDVVDYSEHPQNSFMAPNLGVVYISKTREVLNKWVCEPMGTTREPNFQSFPADLSRWAADHEALRLAQHGPPDAPAGLLSPSGRHTNAADGSSSSTGKHSPRQDSISNSHGPKAHENSPGGGDGKPRPKRILVVDDSSVSSRVACRKIEALGYTTACAYHGRSAFDMLKKAPHMYDIVLSDVMMPVCDGMELLTLIKTSAALKHIPGVLVSWLFLVGVLVSWLF